MSTPLVVAGVALAAAAVTAAYRPPVDAAPTDRFRPPATAYGRGNRGIEYATEPGTVVRAAAPGVVSFAGRIGDGFSVSVVHDDGLRTTYSYLQSLHVGAGDRVEGGRVIGTAGRRFHLGALVGRAYVDPALLFDDPRDRPRRARLVPDDDP